MSGSKSIQKKAQVFKGAQLTQDNRQQVKEGKFILTEATKDIGDDWVDVDVAMPDTIEMAKDLRDETDPRLVKLSEKLDEIQRSLDVELPPIEAEKGKESSKRDLAVHNLELVTRYNELISECDSVLDEKLDQNTEQRVREMKDKVSAERDELENSVLRYRMILAGSSEESRSRKRTYGDALRFQRGEFFDLDEKDAKYTIGGAGTSKLYIMEKEGEKLFFKKETKNSEDPVEVIAAKYAAKYNLSDKLVQEFVRLIHDDEDMGFMRGGVDFYDALLKKVVFVLRQDKYDGRDPKSKLDKRRTYFQSVNRMVKEYNSAKGKKKLALRNWLVDFGLEYNSKVVATDQGGITPGNNLTRRHVATSRMATLLRLDNIVATSRTATVRENGVIYSGNVMSEAKESADKDLKRYAPSAVNQLMQLQVLDLICGQQDRKFGNYTNQADNEGTIHDIVAIDNDISFGEIKYTNLYKQIQPLSYVLIPKDLIRQINELDITRIKYEFMDLITDKEIEFLTDRIKTIKKVFVNAEKHISGLNADEQKMLRDEEIGPLWVMYTYAEDPDMMKRDTLLLPKFVESPGELKEKLIALLNKKGIKNPDMSKFRFLKDYNEPDIDDNNEDNNDEK